MLKSELENAYSNSTNQSQCKCTPRERACIACKILQFNS